jgi:hypothetical protein
MLPLLLPPMLPLLLPPVLLLLLLPVRITNRLPPDSRARRRTSFYYHIMPGSYQRHSHLKLSTFLYHSCYSLKNAASPRRYPFSIINKALAIPGRPVFTLQYKQPTYIPNEEQNRTVDSLKDVQSTVSFIFSLSSLSRAYSLISIPIILVSGVPPLKLTLFYYLPSAVYLPPSHSKCL